MTKQKIKIKSISKSQKIEFLMGNLCFIYCQYFVWREMSRRSFRIRGKRLRQVLLVTLTRSYLLNLAMLLDPEKDNKGNENISIEIIDEPIEDSYKDTIEDIRKIRNKMLAHNDTNAVTNSEDFLKELNLITEQTKELLEHLINLVEKHTSTPCPRKKIYEECVRETQEFLKIN